MKTDLHCPVCKDPLLQPAQLDQQLPDRACSRCGGQWIAGENYRLWLDGHAPASPVAPDAAISTIPDSGPPKLCPECGRFLTRVKVGHGLPFSIDRCAACGGLWLDPHEWEALKQRHLHDRLHHVFSAAWQHEVTRQERASQHEQVLASLLGQSDLQEIQRIKAWLTNHPKRRELYAFLLHE